MKYYSIGDFSKRIGKTIQTLGNWDKDGTLNPAHKTKVGTRYYSQEQELVEDLIQIVTVFSCRLQGKRVNKATKMIRELLEDDTSKKS